MSPRAEDRAHQRGIARWHREGPRRHGRHASFCVCLQLAAAAGLHRRFTRSGRKNALAKSPVKKAMAWWVAARHGRAMGGPRWRWRCAAGGVRLLRRPDRLRGWFLGAPAALTHFLHACGRTTQVKVAAIKPKGMLANGVPDYPTLNEAIATATPVNLTPGNKRSGVATVRDRAGRFFQLRSRNERLRRRSPPSLALPEPMERTCMARTMPRCRAWRDAGDDGLPRHRSARRYVRRGLPERQSRTLLPAEHRMDSLSR